jgi:hypothetical protein
MTPAIAALIEALEDSIDHLDQSSDGRNGNTVRPILARRRRALSQVKSSLKASGEQVYQYRRTTVAPRSIAEAEERLIQCYDKALAEQAFDHQTRLLLNEQRAEAAQGVLSFARQHIPLQPSGGFPMQ